MDIMGRHQAQLTVVMIHAASMAGLYRQRHPGSTVLYRVIATYFDTFLAQYEDRYQKRYWYLRPVVREVVERYLDCANPL